jgi:hypothetical protein
MRTFPLAIFAMLVAVGCQSELKHKEVADQPAKRSIPESEVPLELQSFFSGAPSDNACYHMVQKFYTQKGRWPTNFTELASFPRSSGSSFDPSRYQEVGVTLKTDGRLEIRYQSRDSVLGQGETVLWVDRPQKPNSIQ